MTLFEIPEAPQPRTTTVREHDRRVVPRSRRTDPQTSRAAAASITPGRLERLILSIFILEEPWTDDEICRILHFHHAASLKTARSRLTKSGRLIACGEGVSDRGRRMTKWRLP